MEKISTKTIRTTTSIAVLRINTELGYKPVTFSMLTQDKKFWRGCSTCVNYNILQKKEYKMCLCTAMLYTPTKNKYKIFFNKMKYFFLQ